MAKNKMGIPAVRDRLRELADEHGIEELNDLADQMYRKTGKKRAPRRSPQLTAEQRAEIRQYKADHPDAHQQDIAEIFGVNHGRVSEALDEGD
jgi:chromosome condensin MukBEF complex kleisin-like MukF subunit